MKHNLRQWVVETYKDELKNIAEHGANTGIAGLSYYTELEDLYREFEIEIWDMINEDASNTDESPLSFISKFGGAGDVTDEMLLHGLLVHYAVERIAYEVVSREEEAL